MSQAHKKVTKSVPEGQEAVLAKCNMSGQKGRRVKLDATHLLNFTTDTRSHGYYVGSADANNRARGGTSYSRCYTKEHYLLANAHFVVDAGLDCEGYLAEPDQMLPWESILQVRIITTSPASCPICLSPPDAARITKCGHTYCLPCLMHLFSLAHNCWEACPVCGELVRLADAKPVVSLKKREFRRGDTVNLVKMCRPVSFNYPLPCYLAREGCRGLLKNSDKGVQFSKLIAGDANFLTQVLIRDRKELTRAMRDTLCDLAFVHKSLESLDKALDGAGTQECKDNPPAANLLPDLSPDELAVDLDSSEEFLEEDTPASTPHSSTLLSEEFVFLYQAADGQHIFMDPLNFAMLREEYGTVARCPHRIRASIVSISHHLVSQQLRHRYKWLSHLPLMCEIQFCEVGLAAPLVSHYVLHCFAGTIEKRRLDRQVKLKEEEISEKKAAAYWSKACPGLVQTQPDDELPELSMESFTPLPSTAVPPTATDTTDAALASSFAQALSHTCKPAPPPPELPESPPKQLGDSDSEDEFAPPTYSESMGDAIATKLDAYLKDLEATPKSKIPGRVPRGKKGRGKKVVLFSTSAARPN